MRYLLILIFFFIGCSGEGNKNSESKEIVKKAEEQKISFYGHYINSKINSNNFKLIPNDNKNFYNFETMYIPNKKDEIFDNVKIYTDDNNLIKAVSLTKQYKIGESPYIFAKEIKATLSEKFGNMNCRDMGIAEICKSPIIDNTFVALIAISFPEKGASLSASIRPISEQEIKEYKSVKKF